jgi:hypothetical protein
MRLINVEPLLEGQEPVSMDVHSLDAHPNEALHREVAAILTREMLGR